MIGTNILAWQDYCEQSTRHAEQDAHSDGLLHERDGSTAELLSEAFRYMRFASSTYGQLLLNPVMYREKALSDLVPGDVVQKMKEHAEMDESTYVAHVELTSTWLRPAHVVVHDRSRKELIVAIRGTLCVEDVLTDLGSADVEFFAGGMAHQSMLQSAGHVVECISPVLQRLLPDVERITVTGHSLGAAVATYLTWVLAEVLEEGAGSPGAEPVPGGGFRAAGVSLRCFAFGGPGVCSLGVARGAGSRVFSFCNHEDLVPRVCFGSVVELHERAVAAAKNAPVHCVQLPDIISISGGGDRRGASVLRSYVSKASEAWDWMKRCLSDSMPGERRQHEKLYPAGRIMLLRKDGRVVELDALQAFPRIHIISSMLLDHLPPSYESSLRAAVSESM